MARQMKSRYEANCLDCGAFIPVGTMIRYYGRGKVYGIECHTKEGANDGYDRETKAAKRNGKRNGTPRPLTEGEMERWPEGKIASHYDPDGAYTPDGTYLGHGRGRCEDAPCCGCCP